MSPSVRFSAVLLPAIVLILVVSFYPREVRAEDVKVVDFLASKIWLYNPAGKKDRKVKTTDIKKSVTFPFVVSEASQIKENLIPLPDFEGGRHYIDKRDMMVEAFSCPQGMKLNSGRSLATSGAGACQ
jgi:hypothetical protein